MATSQSPVEAIMRQIAILDDARDVITKAIDDATGSINPEDATWADVARLAAIVDRVKASGILGDDE